MQARTLLWLFSVVVLVALLTVPFAQGATGVVGSCKPGHPTYGSIGNAVSSLPAGSTIYICPGPYQEQVVINKNLTLIGVGGNGLPGPSASGANEPTIVSPVGGAQVNTSDLYQNPNGEPTAAQILVQTPSNQLSKPIVVNISNVIVDGTSAASSFSGCGTDLVGIYYQNASGTIDHVTTRFQELPPSFFGCQDGLAIYAQSGYGTGGSAVVTIENNSVHDYDKNGITADGNGTTATITANYVVGIGATPLTAQNGIQLSGGAIGKVLNNTVTDDIYVNPSPCGGMNEPSCYSASGILLFESGGTSPSAPLAVQGNTVSNTQGAVVAFGDTNGSADYVSAVDNKITTSPAAGIFSIDGIDLCSNNDTATSNTVYNSSGSGIHIDSSCTEASGTTGNGTTVTKNTIVEACAGILLGNGSSSASSNTTYDVLQTTYAGDSCPSSGTLQAARIGVARPAPRTGGRK